MKDSILDLFPNKALATHELIAKLGFIESAFLILLDQKMYSVDGMKEKDNKKWYRHTYNEWKKDFELQGIDKSMSAIEAAIKKLEKLGAVVSFSEDHKSSGENNTVKYYRIDKDKLIDIYDDLAPKKNPVRVTRKFNSAPKKTGNTKPPKQSESQRIIAMSDGADQNKIITEFVKAGLGNPQWQGAMSQKAYVNTKNREGASLLLVDKPLGDMADIILFIHKVGSKKRVEPKFCPKLLTVNDLYANLDGVKRYVDGWGESSSVEHKKPKINVLGQREE